MESLQQRADGIIKQACEVIDAEQVTSSCAKQTVVSVSAGEAIIDFAETEKIDLIVMGSRGLSPGARFKLGSVASQVVKGSPCSVYLVKLPARE